MQFRVAGFPVRVEVVFLLTMAFLAFSSNRETTYVIEWVVVAGVSVLIHELGHAFAFRRFGSPATITLHGFGGVTVGQAQPPRRSIVVSAAGPVAGFAVGVLTLLVQRNLGPQSDLVEVALADMVFVSFVWGAFNLLPILPLDGGGVMASTIRLVTGRDDDRLAHGLSIAASGLVAVGGIVVERPLLAVFAAFFGFQNWQALSRSRDEPDSREIADGRAALLAGDGERALAVAEEILRKPSSKQTRTEAAELAVWAHLGAGRPEAAQASLDQLGGGGVSASHLVRGLAQLAAGRPAPDLGAALGHFSDWEYAPIAADLLVTGRVLDPVLRDVASLPPAQATNALRALQFGLQRGGSFPEAARVGIALYERIPDASTAFLVSRALAAGVDHSDPSPGNPSPGNPSPGNPSPGNPSPGDISEAPAPDPDHPKRDDEVIAWLMKAAGHGWRDTAALDHDRNFDSLRATDGFRTVRTWFESGAQGAGPAQGTTAAS